MSKQRTPEQNVARDQFAAVALEYFLTNSDLFTLYHTDLGDLGSEWYCDRKKEIAEASYNVADAMLQARGA